MKKLTYLLVLMFSLVLVTSCEKDETIDPVTEQTSGEKYPEYMGYWQNDKTTELNGDQYNSIHQWEFDIHDVKAERYDKVGNELNTEYDLWRIEGNSIIFYNEILGNKVFTIIKAPTLTDRTMVLSGALLYHLSLRQ